MSLLGGKQIYIYIYINIPRFSSRILEQSLLVVLVAVGGEARHGCVVGKFHDVRARVFS